MSQLSRDYSAFMMEDLISEFKQVEHSSKGINTKTRTKAIIDAFAAQFDELLKAFNDIETRTVLGTDEKDENGSFIHAHGVQLDGIGDIVDLSRKEASLLSTEICVSSQLDSSKLKSFSDFAVLSKEGERLEQTFQEYLEESAHSEVVNIIPFDVIDDKLYRDFIRYKIFLNNSKGTYRDVLRNIKMFWTASDAVRYQESPFRPATIILSVEDELTPEQNSRLFFMVPVVKAGGVELIRKATTVYPEVDTTIHIGSYLHQGIIEAKLPAWLYDFEPTSSIIPASRGANVLDTTLTEIKDMPKIVKLSQTESGKPGDDGVAVGFYPYYWYETPDWDKLVVPSYIDGKPVTQFLYVGGTPHFKRIYLPPTIRYIGDAAINSCLNLEYIQIYGVNYLSVNEEPSNWSTEWTSYYEKIGNTYEKLSGESAPAWNSGTYYIKYGLEEIGRAIFGMNDSLAVNLKEVNFIGTKEDWDNVVKGEWNNILTDENSTVKITTL